MAKEMKQKYTISSVLHYCPCSSFFEKKRDHLFAVILCFSIFFQCFTTFIILSQLFLKEKGRKQMEKKRRKAEGRGQEKGGGERRGKEKWGEGSREVRKAVDVRERNDLHKNERFWALEPYTCIIHSDKNSKFLYVVTGILILVNG